MKTLKTRYPMEKVAEAVLRQMIAARRELEGAPNTRLNRRLKDHLGILDALDVKVRRTTK